MTSALVGLSIVASTATAFAAGSITGIIENPQVDVTGATIDGQTFTVTLPMVPTAITVIYDASVVASATGLVETNSAEPIYFAFSVLIIAGCAAVIFRKRYAK